MQCPECGARTEVTETRGPFRDRRCLNAACRFDYTTREHIIPQRESRQCARTRATNIETPEAAAIRNKRRSAARRARRASSDGN
jgi:hypothetical protein